jgi:hypothetical protein
MEVEGHHQSFIDQVLNQERDKVLVSDEISNQIKNK